MGGWIKKESLQKERKQSVIMNESWLTGSPAMSTFEVFGANGNDNSIREWVINCLKIEDITFKRNWKKN